METKQTITKQMHSMRNYQDVPKRTISSRTARVMIGMGAICEHTAGYWRTTGRGHGFVADPSHAAEMIMAAE